MLCLINWLSYRLERKIAMDGRMDAGGDNSPSAKEAYG